ncbi:hypothetical protein [Frigidibacter sp. MR17.24]|uniref:hypothetical protein n=1 Tax=Frigidibacter sp. MR17.24 TaxID=3127345 RepID=UPI003012E558
MRLQRDTRAAHDRLDAALARIDLGSASGLAAFLQVQAEGFAMLRAGLGDGAGDPGLAPGLSDLLDEMTAALAADVGPVARPAQVPPLSPDAVAYVTLGSRLGTRALAQRWAAGVAGSRYFALPSRGAEWRDLVARLSARPATGPAADRVTADALTCFSLFDEAAERRGLAGSTRATVSSAA